MISKDSIAAFERIIEALFKTKVFKNTPDLVVTDIHVQPVLTDSYIYFYDDDDNLLLSERANWLCDLDRECLYEEFLKLAQASVKKLKEKSFFDRVNILQPFSFVLVDENRETVNEIDIIDNDTIVLDDELLKGWEEEMDSFINNLLKD